MRLETVSLELAEKLRSAIPSKQRAASLAACRVALIVAPVDEYIVLTAFEELRNQEILSNQRIEQLNVLVDRLDNAYFDEQDKSADEPDSQPEALRLFSQARSVAALSFAGGSDPLSAAMEAIYEASVAVDDAKVVYDAALSVL